MILSTLVRRRVRVGVAADDGVSLLETVVAMTIASFVFLALAGVLVTGLRASLTGHQAENASDVATARLEQVRQLPFAAAEMVTTDLSGDPLIQSGNTFDPGTGTAEPLFVASTGSVNPHITTVCSTGNSPCTGTAYKVGTYITVPTDSGHAGATSYYHRLTVVVTWTTYGQTHTKRASTFLVNTQRGLPLPRFTYRALGPTSRTQNTGALPYWAFTVTNLGARDAWNLSASAGSWTFYVDTNGDGVHQGSEPAMTSLNGYDYDLNGVIDTGALETGGSLSVVAVRSTTLSAVEVGVSTVTFTAKSAAQPNAGTATKWVTFTETVTSPASPTPTATASPTASPTATATPTVTASPNPAPTPVQGCSGSNCSTFHYYYLHNTVPFTGATATQAVLRVDENVPSNALFYDYSTERAQNVSGRYLAPGGSTSSTSSSNVAEWRYQNPINGSMTFSGTATVMVYVMCTANSGPVTLNVAIAQQANGTTLAAMSTPSTGSAVMTTCSTTGWTPLTMGVTLSNFKVAKGNWLAIRVFEPNAGDSPVRLLYDVAPSYEAVAVLPQVKP